MLAIYGQVRHHGFINYDDQDYVTENNHTQMGLTAESVTWAFSLNENDLTYYHPLTYLAHMLDCQLFGVNSGYHHLSNLLIHIFNALLLYAALYTMTGAVYRSAFVALLFAVHPMGVDSVAWIAQKKTLLVTTFWLLSIMAYTRYAKRGGVRNYLLVCLMVIMGLLTKPVMVTIPLVFLLLDFWPLNRLKKKDSSQGTETERRPSQHPWTRLLVEKIPFAFFVALWGITPFISKHVRVKNISLDVVPMGLRFKNAVISYGVYLKKCFWPLDLSVIYPYPREASLFAALLCLFALVIVSAFVILYRRKMPFLVTGWFVFLIVLVPFLGIVQGAVWPAYADRFAYVPLIGIYIIIAWGGYDIIRVFNVKPWLYIPLGLGWICFLSLLSFRQTGYWKDSIRLYTHALEITERNYLAYNNLGIALDEKALSDKAQKQYYLSLWAKPGFSLAHHNLALNFLKQGMMDKAKEHFGLSLISNPHNPVAKYNLGSMSMAEQRFDDAIDYFQGAIADKPDFSDAHNNLGVLLLNKGLKHDAAEHFKQALISDPNHSEALCNLGNALFDMGRPDHGVMCFKRALSLDPKNIRALNDLGVIFASTGNWPQAEKMFNTVLELDPDNAYAQENRQLIYNEKKIVEDEYAQAGHALEQAPDNMDALGRLARLSGLLNKTHECESLYMKMLDMDPGNGPAITGLAQIYEDGAQYDKAIMYYHKLAENHGDQRAEAYYAMACMFALENHENDAVSWLQKAADSGFSDWNSLMLDRRLDTIRSSKLFREFLTVAGLN